MSEPSNAFSLADAFVQGMEREKDVNVSVLQLKKLRIDHFRLDFYDPVCHQEEDFCKVQELLERADGVVIATPVWNFSVPAHLKNLIDRMGSFALDETRTKGTLNGKPFYLLFTTGAQKSAWLIQKHTTSHLPWSLQFFGGKIAGVHVEGGCVKGEGEFGLVMGARAEALERVRRKGQRFVSALREGKVRHHGNLILTLALKFHRVQKAVVRLAWGWRKQ